MRRAWRCRCTRTSLARERFLFYAAVSRAEEVLFVSFRSSDEEGEPQLRSPFVDDLRDLFTPALWADRGRRLLAEVTWPPAQAPTPLELRRAQAVARNGATETPLAPPRTPAVLADLAAREVESARGLEAFAACGVRWLVERVLKPGRIDPDPEPMQRGSLAHAVLERTLRALKERTGSARLAPETFPAAREELRTALRELATSRAGARARAGLRALEVDLVRWLEGECHAGPGFEPRLLEWSFGGEDDAGGTLDLGVIRVSGRVDRVDVGRAAPRWCATTRTPRAYPRRTWAEDGHLQAALYALAVRDVLGLSPGRRGLPAPARQGPAPARRRRRGGRGGRPGGQRRRWSRRSGRRCSTSWPARRATRRGGCAPARSARARSAARPSAARIPASAARRRPPRRGTGEAA